MRQIRARVAMNFWQIAAGFAVLGFCCAGRQQALMDGRVGNIARFKGDRLIGYRVWAWCIASWSLIVAAALALLYGGFHG